MQLRIIIISVVLLTLALAPALAHVEWANGEPIPDWVKHQCCGVADAHHLRPEQIRAVAGGYQIIGDQHTRMPGQPPLAIAPGLIPYNRVLPSPDGEWWVFYSDTPLYKGDKGGIGDDSLAFIYCVFGPINSV